MRHVKSLLISQCTAIDSKGGPRTSVGSMTAGLMVSNEGDAQRNMRTRATAPAISSTEPPNTIAAASFIATRKTCGLLAAGTIRMPISFRRLTTACAAPLKNPTHAGIDAGPLTEAHVGQLMRHVLRLMRVMLTAQWWAGASKAERSQPGMASSWCGFDWSRHTSTFVISKSE